MTEITWTESRVKLLDLFRSPQKSMEIGGLIWIGFQQDFSSFCIVYPTEVIANLALPFQAYLSCLIYFYHIEKNHYNSI